LGRHAGLKRWAFVSLFITTRFYPLSCHVPGFGHCTKIPFSLMAAFRTVVERALHGRGVWGHFTTWHRGNILWRLSMILRQDWSAAFRSGTGRKGYPAMVLKEVHGFEVHGLQGTDRREGFGDSSTLHSSPICCVIISLHLLLRVWTLLSQDKTVSCKGDWELSGVLRT
jgi:hypothetical protein